MSEIRISKKLLDKLSEQSSRALVGKVLKRIESIQNQSDLKASVKDVVYEHYRELFILLETVSAELEKYRINFKDQD